MADQNLSATYVTTRKVADQADLEARINALQPPEPEVLGPPSPKPGQMPKPEKPGFLGAVGGAMKDVAFEGASNFFQGLANRPKGLTDLEGHGQSLLGVLQIASALPAGAGAALRHAVENWVPGMDEHTVVIPGGKAGETSITGIIRAVMAAPSLALDPNLKKAIAENPEAAAAAFNAPITAGELADMVGQFAVMAKANAIMGRVVGAGKGPSGPAGPAGSIRRPMHPPAGFGEVAGPPTPVGPGYGGVYGPPSMAPVAEVRQGVPPPAMPPDATGAIPDPILRTAQELAMQYRQAAQGRQQPGSLADRLREIYRPDRTPEGPPTVLQGEAPPTGPLVDAQGRPVPAGQTGSMSDREQLRVMNRTQMSEEPAARPGEAPSAPEAPPAAGGLESSVDHALKRSQQIIEQEYQQAKGEVQGPTRAGRFADYKARAEALKKAKEAPPPEPGAETPPTEPGAAPAGGEAPSAGPSPSEPAAAVWKKSTNAGNKDGQTVTVGEQSYEVYWDKQSGTWRAVDLKGKGPKSQTIDVVGRNKAEVVEAVRSGKLGEKIKEWQGPPRPAHAFEGMTIPEQDAVFQTLEMMQDQAKNAEPGRRILQTDELGKVTGGLRQPSTFPEFMDSLGIRRTTENAKKLVDVIENVKKGEPAGSWGERVIDYVRSNWESWASKYGYRPEGGQVDPALLARMALGAAAGGTQGETTEDRIRNALLGMGIGAVLSKNIAVKIRDAYRESGLADETGAFDFSKFTGKRPSVQASEQPFQPNYKRLDVTPDVAAFMKQVHRAIKDDILNRAGPARSNNARVQEALTMIDESKMTPERVLTLGDREMLTDTEITAARMLSAKAFEHANEIKGKVLADDPTVPEGSLSQAIAVAGAMGRNVRVAQRRIAQAEQASSIKVHGEGTGYRPEDVASLADEIHNGMTDKQIATMMADIKSPSQLERASVWLTLFPKMLLQGIYFSYLSGKAIPRNAVGNGTLMGLAPVERGIGRFMPLWGSTKPGILPGEAVQMARALGDSLVDQVRMLRHIDQIEAAARRSGVDLSAYKSERRGPAGRAFLEEAGVENDVLLKMGDWYDNVTTFPGDVLDKTDIMSKTINANMAHRLEAFRQATFEGLAGDAFESRVAVLLDDVSQLSDSARQRISDFSSKQTFTQEFQGRVLRALAQGPESEWGNLMYRAFVMPFFRVAARMTESTLERAPGLNFLLKSVREDWKAGGVQRQMVQARMVSGAAIVGAFMYLEGQGGMTGNAPKDPVKRKMWEDAGYQERSWWDPVFKKWRSYDGLGPLTTLMAAAADTSMVARQVPEATAAQLYGAYVLSQINSLDSRTFTQQPSHIMDVIKNPRPDAQVDQAMDLLRHQIASWMKPGLAREIKNMTDPEIRRVLRNGELPEGSLQQEFQALLDDVRSGWPSWSDAKDANGDHLIPAERDRLTGQTIIYESWPFNPFPGRTPKDDLPVTLANGTKTTVRKEIERLQYAGLDGWPEYLGGSRPSPENVGFTPPSPRAGVRLTPQERSRFAVLMTQVVKDDNGHTYAQALQDLMGGQQAQFYAEQSEGSNGAGPDGGKALAIRRLDQGFRELAEQELYAEGRDTQGRPGKLERLTLEKKVGRKLELVPTREQPEVRRSFQQQMQDLRGLPNTLLR